MTDLEAIRDGINSDVERWIAFNHKGAFEVPDGLDHVAPFPPPELMNLVSGLTDQWQFAKSGCDIFQALSLASPKPLNGFKAILDFGVGVGRLARLFKGLRGRYAGIDVDSRHVAWVNSALKHVDAYALNPRTEFPFARRTFDCVISVSVFTHMSERDQFFYLKELARVARGGATLLLTVHGERALQRAEQEERIFKMIDVPREGVVQARAAFAAAGYKFIGQHADLHKAVGGNIPAAPPPPPSFWDRFKTPPPPPEDYEYGITFISEDYVRRVWGKFFDIARFCPAAIHDFQDIVVLKGKPWWKRLF